MGISVVILRSHAPSSRHRACMKSSMCLTRTHHAVHPLRKRPAIRPIVREWQ